MIPGTCRFWTGPASRYGIAFSICSNSVRMIMNIINGNNNAADIGVAGDNDFLFAQISL